MPKLTKFNAATAQRYSCHELGVCQSGESACPGACVKVQRLAPGVIDGPYYRSLTRTEQLARVLLVAACTAAAVAVIARLTGWL